jgi:hypothetical protein
MLDFDKQRIIRASLKTHPNIGSQEKMILICNTPSYFKKVETDTPIAQLAHSLHCSEPLAQEYKKIFLEIDWARNSDMDKLNIQRLIDITVRTMFPDNVDGPPQNTQNNSQFFMPTPAPLAFNQQRELPETESNSSPHL